jgi:hypothetical protein
MKKTLIKIALVAALSLSTIPGWSKALAVPMKFIEAFKTPKGSHHFSHLLAMGTQENLKTYHLGLQALFPDYQIPSAQDLLDAIESHPQFFGTLTQSEAIEQFERNAHPFIIFEEDKGHFYIAHSGGLRHFTIAGREFPRFDNGQDFRYPDLSHFLESTLV